ncbi:MAG: hypothetical protein ACKO34_05875 [Vampirovibrionales bacterium]
MFLARLWFTLSALLTLLIVIVAVIWLAQQPALFLPSAQPFQASVTGWVGAVLLSIGTLVGMATVLQLAPVWQWWQQRQLTNVYHHALQAEKATLNHEELQRHTMQLQQKINTLEAALAKALQSSSISPAPPEAKQEPLDSSDE